MTHVLLLSGAGAYSDPWHDFAQTSARIAETIRELGVAVELSEDLEGGLARLEPASSRVDLLVVNAGNPASNGLVPDTDPDATAGLTTFLARGGPILAVHAAANTLPDVEAWEAAIGGRWIRGTSTHPPRSRTVIDVCTDAHPIVAGMADFEVDDERYSYLRTGEDIVVLTQHRFQDQLHPICWARESHGSRAVYDGLGHGVQSYESADRRDLLHRSVRWLLASEADLRDGPARRSPTR